MSDRATPRARRTDVSPRTSSPTAPIDASSGDHVRHRLSRGGNRQINRVLHTMAVVQLRNATLGRAYYDRLKSEGKTSMEAMRALKRRRRRRRSAAPDAVVLADGFSCRTQVDDLRDRPSVNLAQLLAPGP
ncbi:transposase [Cryptosporangium sp. NPDC051539]|uniref:transposase n=1 Tax=Cryptosporangium sp. NPDC051539 TaxID=3363962 RepID=UPI0037A761DF